MIRSPVSIASTRGFEPPTYRLGGGRSILLSYVDIYISYSLVSLCYIFLLRRIDDRKIHHPLKPYRALESSSFCGLTHKVFLVDTDFQHEVITVQCYNTGNIQITRREFPGGPVVKIPGFHSRGRVCHPWWRN